MQTQTNQITELATCGNIAVLLYSVNKKRWQFSTRYEIALNDALICSFRDSQGPKYSTNSAENKNTKLKMKIENMGQLTSLVTLTAISSFKKRSIRRVTTVITRPSLFNLRPSIKQPYVQTNSVYLSLWRSCARSKLWSYESYVYYRSLSSGLISFSMSTLILQSVLSFGSIHQSLIK